MLAFAGGNQHIRIREKTLEFSSTVISTLSPYLVAFDLHMAQLMPLPLSVSCFSKIQIGFTFLMPAHLCSPRKRAVKRVCVCACVRAGGQLFDCIQPRCPWSARSMLPVFQWPICSSLPAAATSRRYCFSHLTLHHSVQLCDRL